jgi:cleavage and polyadenylation specificity factor subunit 3
VNASSSEERLQRLFWFLEAQFGADNVAPIAEPKLPALPKKNGNGGADGASKVEDSDASMELDDEGGEDEQKRLGERKKAELERLHRVGVPVPGVEIKVDKMVARVWLEDLEVECSHKVFADRVRAVVDRACETIAPLWGT